MPMNNDADRSEGSVHHPFTKQHFVTLVRTELAAMNRPKVKIESAWIDEETPGHPFLLNVVDRRRSGTP